MKLTLVLPPFTQFNTPYPSISYLARHMRAQGYEVAQRDFGIELALRIFSKNGLSEIFKIAEEKGELPEQAWQMLALSKQYIRSINPVIAFLQGKDRSLATRIIQSELLPIGPRLEHASIDRFGEMGIEDAARYLCTLYLEDIADFITTTIDSGFGFAKYQHHLAAGPIAFSDLENRVQQTTIIDQWLDDLVDTIETPVVGISIPFPGTLYAALRMGKRLKQRGKVVWMGGGYVNTELRDLDEPHFWQYCDALTFDDGEGPLKALLEHTAGQKNWLHRTQTVNGKHWGGQYKTPFVPTADYQGLNRNLYLQIIDSLNPAHRLWSDGRWNKMTLAHGCYWKKCAFCDIQLDYISRFIPTETKKLVDQIEELVAQTGTSGFHFVDEAAPPRAMRDLALELLRRDVVISWWGNIRFERSFSVDLCRLLSAAGLIAVTGGLEVANDRLLKLMQKGVDIKQAVHTSGAFQHAGVMVHAYLMYGFPTQTAAETIEAMEITRQLFANGLLNSAFWHRFVLTRHSDIYTNPDKYHVKIPPLRKSVFATNDLPHIDLKGGNHNQFDEILPRALQFWMKGERLHDPIQSFLPRKLRKKHMNQLPPPNMVANHLQAQRLPLAKDNQQLIWLGGEVLLDNNCVILHTNNERTPLQVPTDQIDWLLEVLDAASPTTTPLLFQEARDAFPGKWQQFQHHWTKIRKIGLICI